jgi:hypothetical protein
VFVRLVVCLLFICYYFFVYVFILFFISVARLQEMSVPVLFSLSSVIDAQNPSQNIAQLDQSGLGKQSTKHTKHKIQTQTENTENTHTHTHQAYPILLFTTTQRLFRYI